MNNVELVQEHRPRQGWRRLILSAATIGALVAAWPAYVWYVKPRLDERRVEALLNALSAKGEEFRKGIEELKGMPREQMLLGVFRHAKEPVPGLNEVARIAGARASLEMAISGGSVEAAIELGKALRDGILGANDSAAALREFERVVSDIEPGVKVGDPNALYWDAIMKSEGLGVTIDGDAALVAMKRAAEGLSGTRLKRVAGDASEGGGLFKGKRDAELAGRLASRLMDEGDPSAYAIGLSSCESPSAAVAEQTDETREARRLERRREAACQRPWTSRAAKSGIKPAMADYAYDLLRMEGNLAEAKRWYEAAGSERSVPEDYMFGLVLALTAPDTETVVGGVKRMWVALQQDQKRRHPTLGASADEVEMALWQTKKAWSGAGQGDERRNLAIALLAQADLMGSDFAETIQAVRREERFARRTDSPPVPRSESLVALIEAPSNRRTASLIAEAIRSNKSVEELTIASPSHRQEPLLAALPRVNKPGAEQGAIATSQIDPEQQSRSGYLPNSPRAGTGLSTFAVDNTKGSADAVVRLYLGGKKPQARGFYVKRGDVFTVKSLAHGSYVMRYRLIGSDDTYEADKQFVLTESDSEGGRRFSNVTITLYGRRDGNLPTKKVAPEQF